MMKIILGWEQPDSGSITTPRDCTIGYLPQEIFSGENKAWDREKESLTLRGLVSQAFSRLEDIEKQLESIERDFARGDLTNAKQDEYDRLQIEYENAGGFTWQAKLNRLLKGFGFPESRFDDPLKTFSGGWQMRAYFARLLLSEPDYLLLDEPTNYLDIASISFLEEYLNNYQGGILVVSHDRYFLDQLANSVVAIVPEGAKMFRGNYSQFLQAREEWAKEAEAAQARQDKERKRVERFIERFRYKASKATQVQSRIKQLKKIEKIEQIRSIPKLKFRFPECESSGEVVLKCENICKSYGENSVLRGLDFSIERGDRLAIIGENGTGKTTLMNIIAGEDFNWHGNLEWGYRVHFGYFAQDEEISFEGDETIWQRMLRETPLDAVPELRKLLGAFLFSGDDVDKKVSVLSGGEKSRLGLARLMLRPCNLLLLDEPTNHLDLNSREALLDALEDFPGTIIIVSHDRFFLDSLATRVLSLKHGKATSYKGNYSEFIWAAKYRVEESEEKNRETAQTVTDKKQQAREIYRLQKQLNNKAQRLRKDISDNEAMINDVENSIAGIESQLASPPPEFNADKIAEVSCRHAELNNDLDNAMKTWENLHSELDQIEGQLEKLKEGVC
jgi:ATP-binding cassette subfamily F protein 3